MRRTLAGDDVRPEVAVNVAEGDFDPADVPRVGECLEQDEQGAVLIKPPMAKAIHKK